MADDRKPQPGLFDRLEKEKAEFLAAIRGMVREELESFAREHVIDRQLLYTRIQAAKLLGISEASLAVLVVKGLLKVRRFGSRRLLAHEDLVKLAKRDIAQIWPDKVEGKTVRRIA